MQISELKNYISNKEEILIVGKGPFSNLYMEYINESTTAIGINELTLLPNIKFGFIIDYEPMQYLLDKNNSNNSNGKKLILSLYPNIKKNDKISKPSKISISNLKIYNELELNYGGIFLFENRYRSNCKDLTPNLVSVISLLKILKSIDVSTVSTVGIGSSVGYINSANTNFGTQLQLGYGQQIPLIYKISKNIGIKIIRHEIENVIINIINTKSESQFEVYKNFIVNVLMLKNNNIINRSNNADFQESIVIDCNKLYPQSLFFASNIRKEIVNYSFKHKIAFQELMPFFVDKRILNLHKNKWNFYGKKTPLYGFYLAIYQSTMESNQVKIVHIIKFIKQMDYFFVGKDKFKKSNILDCCLYLLIYINLYLYENYYNINIYIRTTKLYFLINQWRK